MSPLQKSPEGLFQTTQVALTEYNPPKMLCHSSRQTAKYLED